MGGILPCGVDTNVSAYSDGIKILSSFAHGEVQHPSINQAEGAAAHRTKGASYPRAGSGNVLNLVCTMTQCWHGVEAPIAMYMYGGTSNCHGTLCQE